MLIVLATLLVCLFGGMAVFRRSPRGALNDTQRREVVDACLALGVAKERIDEVLAKNDDEALVLFYREEHRRSRARRPFR